MRVLVTGNAGFIGYHLCWRLLERDDSVVGFDSVNDYYDPQLKNVRLARLTHFADHEGFDYTMIKADLADRDALNSCFDNYSFDRVIHLAAQAGVRHSLNQPLDYVHSNLVGFTNLLEACRHHQVPHLTYASTSSVYGANTALPFSEHMHAVHPLQFYAATKRANELMAHSYSHLFDLPTTGLRFFTVYGPWGRPDMALFLFTCNILKGEPIEVFNHGKHTRDFTYIDDIVEAVIRASDDVAQSKEDWDGAHPDPSTSSAPWRLFNIGNSQPVQLLDYIHAIEKATGIEAKQKLLPSQPGDAPDTFADTTILEQHIGYRPDTGIEEGVTRFVEWFREYYQL